MVTLNVDAQGVKLDRCCNNVLVLTPAVDLEAVDFHLPSAAEGQRKAMKNLLVIVNGRRQPNGAESLPEPAVIVLFYIKAFPVFGSFYPLRRGHHGKHQPY